MRGPVEQRWERPNGGRSLGKTGDRGPGRGQPHSASFSSFVRGGRPAVVPRCSFGCSKVAQGVPRKCWRSTGKLCERAEANESQTARAEAGSRLPSEVGEN